MSKIKNEWPTESREAMLYRRTLAAAARKSALNAVEFEKRGIPYEEVYRCTSRQLARRWAGSSSQAAPRGLSWVGYAC